jgi:hypothetical protein
MYVSVRGRIELEHSQRPAAEEIIEQARDIHPSGAAKRAHCHAPPDL